MIPTKTIDGLTYEAVPEEVPNDCEGCVAFGHGSLCTSLSIDGLDDEHCYDNHIIWKKVVKGCNKEFEAKLPGTTAQDVKDMINPSHYKVGGIETINYLQAKLTPEEFTGYLKGNALKYLSRSSHKHDDPVEDYKKARWYINRLVSTLEVQET